MSSTFKMLLYAHHLYRNLFYHGYGFTNITDHLMLTHIQMSKGLIMFGKQLSWSPAGFLKPFLKKKKKKFLQQHLCSLMQQKGKEKVICDPQRGLSEP